jgi:hypothetical protein
MKTAQIRRHGCRCYQFLGEFAKQTPMFKIRKDADFEQHLAKGQSQSGIRHQASGIRHQAIIHII